MPDLFGADAVMVVGILLATAMAAILLTLGTRVWLELRRHRTQEAARSGEGQRAHAMASLFRRAVPLSA